MFSLLWHTIEMSTDLEITSIFFSHLELFVTGNDAFCIFADMANTPMVHLQVSAITQNAKAHNIYHMWVNYVVWVLLRAILRRL